MTEFWLLLAPTEPTECSVLSENLYVVGPRLYTTAGLSDRTPAWVLHIIEYTAPTPLLQTQLTLHAAVHGQFLGGPELGRPQGNASEQARRPVPRTP